MQASTTKGDVLQRIAGVSFIVAAILTLVFNALFPREDPTNTRLMLLKWADNKTLTLIVFLGLMGGFWAILIGVAGVYRSITTGGAAAWTRLGFYGTVVGTTMATASMAIGMATTRAAADWVAAGAEPTAPEYNIAATLSFTSGHLWYVTIIVFWLALAFLAVGMVTSNVYPKWIGWAFLILGVVTVVVAGVPLALGGANESLDNVFGVLGGLSSLVILILGVWITRRQMQLM